MCSIPVGSHIIARIRPHLSKRYIWEGLFSITVFLPFILFFGVAIGVAVNNIGMGIAIGVAIGVGIGVSMSPPKTPN